MLHLVVRGGGNSIWHGRFDLAADDFIGWERLPGATASSPGLAGSPGGDLYVAVRGMDDRIYWMDYGSDPYGWRRVPAGSTGDGVGMAVAGSSLHIAVKGSSSNGIYVNRMNMADGRWQGWERLTGATPSEPQLCPQE